MTTEHEDVSESEWKILATTETTHLTDEEKDYLPRAWDEWIARVRRDAKAEAWDEAYRRGVDDARIADELRVEVGLGPDLYAQPARQNPYETGGQA